MPGEFKIEITGVNMLEKEHTNISEASIKRLPPKDGPTHLTGRSCDGQVVGKSVQEHLLLLGRLS